MLLNGVSGTLFKFTDATSSGIELTATEAGKRQTFGFSRRTAAYAEVTEPRGINLCCGADGLFTSGTTLVREMFFVGGDG